MFRVKLEIHFCEIFVEPDPEDPEDHDLEFIDVTIPLQCLIKDSKLVLHEQSKVTTVISFF